MFFSHVVRSEDRDKRCGRRGPFYIRTPMRILAFDQTHRADHFKTKRPRGFDGVDRRSSRRANIVDDHDLRTGLAKAFNTLAGAVLLLGLADEEAVQSSAGDGYRDDNWIGAHRQSADGTRFPALLANFFEKYLADQLAAAGVERS